MTGPISSGAPKVVVVDDDRQVRDSLVELLSSLGCEITAYENGTDFLQHVQGDDPQCAILDLRLPDMSGLDVQAKLTARSIRVPLIFASGGARPNEVKKALAQGAVAFLDKPIDAQVLSQHVQRVVFHKP